MTVVVINKFIDCISFYMLSITFIVLCLVRNLTFVKKQEDIAGKMLILI